MSSSIHYEIRNITPSNAQEWLLHRRATGRNRSTVVRAYADDMRNGRWVFNGDPIIISESGVVLSGVLRLEACMRSNSSFPSLVIYNVKDESFETIDSVRRRTFADILTIRKEKNGRALAAALTIIWRYAKDDYSKPSQSPTAKMILTMLEHNPDIRLSMRLAADSARLMSLGVVAAMHYLFSRVDAAKAEDFFQSLVDDETTSGPTFLLRRQLTLLKEDRGARSQGAIIGLFIKAWEAFCSGQNIQQLRFTPGVDRSPRISGLSPSELIQGLHLNEQAGMEDQVTSTPQGDLSQLKVEVKELSPQDAERLLQNNDQNRGIASLVVDKYARDMVADNWKLNGQTIKIGSSGRLLDGQHRLMACWKSGRPFPAIIVSGLDDRVFDTFDLGARRSIGEILKDRGELNASSLGAALRQLWLLENSFYNNRGASPTVAEMLDTLERHPGIRNSIRHGRRVIDVTAPTIVVALHYMFSLIDKSASDYFVERLIDGAELSTGDPILVLRDQLLKAKAKQKTTLPDAERAAWIIKAWNAFMMSRKINRIKWQQVGPRRESFPVIYGLEGSMEKAA